jgi:hypothetical protein
MTTTATKIYNSLIDCEIKKRAIENKSLGEFDPLDMIVLQKLDEKIKFYKIMLGLETCEAISHCENIIKGGDVLC